MNNASNGEDEIDDIVIDGDVIRGSWSSCAAKVRLNPLRYLWYGFEVSLLRWAWTGLAGATILALLLRWWILGGLLLLPLVALTVLLRWTVGRMGEIYQHAALTAGLVVSKKPLEFISLANMDTGYGEEAYAVKREEIDRLPCHPEEVGSLFPCVSGFQAGPSEKRWGDFTPRPLSFGTGDKALIAARRAKLGEEAFAELLKVFQEGKFPAKPRQLLWLDEEYDPKIPPPLPEE